MAQATIISVFPFETVEIKPGLARGYFKLPACPEDKDFIVHHFEDSFFTLRLPATTQHINVPVTSIQIARSIVRDFCMSHVCATHDAHPGMACLEGKITAPEVISKYKSVVEDIQAKQIRWFEELLKQAQNDWEQFHNQGLISFHQRYAARKLNYDAPWLIDYNPAAELKECPACFENIHIKAIRCPKCLAILDMKKAAEFGLLPTQALAGK